MIKGGESVLDFIEMMMRHCQHNQGGGYLIQPLSSKPPVALSLLNPMLVVDPFYSQPLPYKDLTDRDTAG